MSMKKVPMKRRKEGRTDYRQRLALLRSGKSRLVVRRSNQHFTAQLVQYAEDGDEVVTSAHSSELRDFGWKGATGNTSAAYLTGYLLGTRADTEEAVLDIGMQQADRGANIFAVALGAQEAGLFIPVGDSVAPSEERIRGEHIAAYADEGNFTRYEERGLNPADLPDHFEETKEEIAQEAEE